MIRDYGAVAVINAFVLVVVIAVVGIVLPIGSWIVESNKTQIGFIYTLCASQALCCIAWVVGLLFGSRRKTHFSFFVCAVWWTLLSVVQLLVGTLCVYILIRFWMDISILTTVMCFTSAVIPLWLVQYLISLIYGAAGLGLFYSWEYLKDMFSKKISYTNKHVFITGGGTGLGKELAKIFAMENAKVTIISRNEHHLHTVKEEIEAQGGVCQYFICDVTNPEQVKNCVEEAKENFGTVDVVVCSAGLSHPNYFTETPPDACRHELNLNFMGTYNTVYACIPGMLEKKSGQIVLVSSGLGLMGAIGYSHYSASKFALRGFGESLRMEYTARGITTHIFFPSNMSTPGYELEMVSKPPESRMIDESTACASPVDAARVCFKGVSLGEFAFTNSLDLEFVQMATVGITCPCRAPLRYWLIAPVWYIGVAIQRALWMTALAKFNSKKSPLIDDKISDLQQLRKKD